MSTPESNMDRRRHAPFSRARTRFMAGTVAPGTRAMGVGVVVAVLALVLILTPDSLLAQTQAAQPGQDARQMRHFWHVFVAYGIAWLLVFGWAVSIARRLARVEEKLGR